MIVKKLIAEIKKFRGPIYVEVQNFNDVFYVQAVKGDLIKMLEDGFGANMAKNLDEECGFELDKNGYFGKDFAVA